MEKVLHLKATVTHRNLFPKSINRFLLNFKGIEIQDIRKGKTFDFKLNLIKRYQKPNPILQIANEKDAVEITKIIKDLYNKTYPYKEFEDSNEVRSKINDPEYLFILFKDNSERIIGLIVAQANFRKKRGYLARLAVRKEFHGKYDLIKALIGAMLIIYKYFQNKILIWFGEARTAHSKSQYLISAVGIKPIAFLPNKDIFFDEIESDLMVIIYNDNIFKKYRNTQCPIIIPEILNCYNFSNDYYNLGTVEIRNPQIYLNPYLLSQLRKNLKVSKQKKKFGYTTYYFHFKNSTSFIKFLYTQRLNNIEKLEYYVNNLEELVTFLHKINTFMEKKKVRYIESFVSAYGPDHQKIFYQFGLFPRGYLPSWEYNEKNGRFDDMIVFNRFEGSLAKNLQLIPEGYELLKSLDLD